MRFGLLGTGPWAEMVHGPGLAEHPEAELVGLWGRDPEKTARLAVQLGCKAYEDRGQLLKEVEAVSFCLPPTLQAAVAVEAAEAGCNLLLEKPLALSRQAAEGVALAVEKAGVASLVFYTALFDQTLDSFFEELGKNSWVTADILMLGSIFEGDSPFGDSPWRREKGALWDIGPHSLAWAVAGLGPVASASLERGIGDLVHLVARHEGGATSSHTLSLTTPRATDYFGAMFFGPAGVLQMPSEEGSSVAAYKQAVDQLIEAASSGRPHRLSAAHGVGIVAALEQAEAGS